MTQQLHVIIALERAKRIRAKEELTALYHAAQHPPMFMGGTKEMRSLNEEVPNEPAEVTLPPLTAAKVFRRIEAILTDAWDLMATRDRSNADAKGTIVVDGQVLAADVPVTTLLALEKQLTDVRAMISKLPVLDPSKVWTEDAEQGFWRAPEQRKPKTRKTIKPISLAAATKEHKEQVHALNTDEIVGEFIATDFSGAIPAQDRESHVDRVNKVLDAVRVARTEANKVEVTEVRLASELLGYVFAR